jgi:serine/threonine protein kinase
MVAGTLPFDGATLQETRERILAGFFELPAFISESCVSLLQAMLVIDPAKRCDLNSVMRHPWLYSDTADLRDLGNAWEPHYWLEDGLLGDNISVDDSEMNE